MFYVKINDLKAGRSLEDNLKKSKLTDFIEEELGLNFDWEHSAEKIVATEDANRVLAKWEIENNKGFDNPYYREEVVNSIANKILELRKKEESNFSEVVNSVMLEMHPTEKHKEHFLKDRK